MDSSGANDPRATQLRFYCRDCEVVFKSAPDGTGYEQSPCPTCGEMCLTEEFEQEEQWRNSNGASFASLLTWMMKSSRLGSLVWEWCAEEPSSSRAAEAVTIVRYESREDAEADVRMLSEHGIPATIVGDAPGVASRTDPNALPPIGLQVPAPMALTATKTLRATDPPEPQKNTAEAAQGNIDFACEECGGTLSFPANCCGKVELCYHCGRYVDVPESY